MTKRVIQRCRRGFTLVELLVSMGIIGILLALLLPAVQAMRESARKSDCLNRIRQVALAVASYEESHSTMPIGWQGDIGLPYPFMSWMGAILPFVEEYALWDSAVYHYRLHVDPFTQPALRTAVVAYGCPSDRRTGIPQVTHEGRVVGLTSYLGVSGIDYQNMNGCLVTSVAVPLKDVSDGLTAC